MYHTRSKDCSCWVLWILLAATAVSCSSSSGSSASSIFRKLSSPSFIRHSGPSSISLRVSKLTKDISNLLSHDRDIIHCRGGGDVASNNDCETNGGEVVEVKQSKDVAVGDKFSNARILYVKQSLIDRLHYVEKRSRMSDFAKWVHQQGGETKVFSAHGIDADSALDSAVQEEYSKHNPLRLSANNEENGSSSTKTKRTKKKKGPFDEDILNLDLITQDMTAEVTDESSEEDDDSDSLQMAQFSNILFRNKHLIEDDKDPSALSLFFRTFQLSFHFFPVISTMWLAILSRKFREDYWYVIIADSLANGGAAFIKWGQWAATRNDMFSDSLCDALSRLHNTAPAHSWKVSKQTVEASLGIPAGSLLEVFDEFDEEPMASGSIAQVHRASLNGIPVIVKIRHPKVAKKINMDFRIMTAATRIFDYIPGLSWLHIRESVDQFSHTMASQAHLHVEAHHLEVLNHNFRRWPSVRFPEPFYASPAVIIETFEPGQIVTDVYHQYEGGTDAPAEVVEAENEEAEEAKVVKKNAMFNEDYDPTTLVPVDMAKFIVTTGSGLYLKMLMVDNLMHADFHPGNILIHYVPKNSRFRKDQERRDFCISVVDAGMVAQLTDEESATFLGLMASLGEGDGESAAEYALNFCLEGGNDAMRKEDRDEFVREMGELFREHCRGYRTNVSMGAVLKGVLGLIRKHQVRIDANFATLTVNLLCLESMARRACPDYNILDCAQPILSTYRKMRYRRDGTPIPLAELKRSIKKLLPLMFIQKKRNDDTFFREYERYLKEYELSLREAA